MSDDEKFREIEMLLAAYRPDGSDAADADMQEALARVDEDDALRALFEDSQAFDAAVSDAICSFPVPEGLRDEIIATAHRSASRKRPQLLHALLPIAAVILVSLGTIFFFTQAPSEPGGAGSFALLNSVTKGEVQPDLEGSDPASTLNWLQERFDSSMALPVSLASLPSRACSFRNGPEGKIALICFEGGEGTIVHLVVEQDEGDANGLPQSCCRSKVEVKDGWDTIVWTNAGRRYTLAAKSESVRCCKRLREIAGVRA